jgi:hypothetical protein
VGKSKNIFSAPLIRIETVAYGHLAQDNWLSVEEPETPETVSWEYRQPTKIVSTFTIQSVRKSGMVVLVYDSVDKKKNL